MSVNTTGAELAEKLGAAANEVEDAVEVYRQKGSIDLRDVKRMNESLDDLQHAVQRVSTAHERLMARSQTAAMQRQQIVQ